MMWLCDILDNHPALAVLTILMARAPLLENGGDCAAANHYFSSTMIARAEPFTTSSVCDRFGALNFVRPNEIGLMSTFPSGVVDFSSPSARYTTTTSLSWKCIGVGLPAVHV